MIPPRVAIAAFMLGGVGGFLIGSGAGWWLAPVLFLAVLSAIYANRVPR